MKFTYLISFFLLVAKTSVNPVDFFNEIQQQQGQDVGIAHQRPLREPTLYYRTG